MLRHFFRSRLAAPAVALAVLLVGQASWARSLTSRVKSDSGSIVLTKPAASGEIVEALLQKARTQDRVRVMVGLRVTLRSESTLSEPELNRQRQELRDLGSAVVRRALAGGALEAAEVFAFRTVPYLAMFADAAQLRRLVDDPQVVSLEHHAPFAPSTGQTLTSTYRWDAAAAVGSEELLAKGYSGEHTIAILDSGVESGKRKDQRGNRIGAHPMLVGKVVSEACFSNSEGSGQSLCKNGRSTVSAAVRQGDGSADPCDVTLPGCWQGTHLAAIAAGNSGSRFGVARGANLVAMQIFTRMPPGEHCGLAACIRAHAEDLARALENIFDLTKPFPRLGVVLVGLASGKYAEACDASFPLLTHLVLELEKAGVAVVAPAGDGNFDGFVSAPACLSRVVSVGNATPDDKVYSAANGGSNHSPLVTLTAPGTSVVSAYPPGSYAEANGTAQAAAHVAGGFAMLRQVKPNASVAEIVKAASCTENQVERGGVVKPRLTLGDAYKFLVRTKSGSRRWDFSRSADAEDWVPISGNWAAQGGVYIGTSASGAENIAAALPNCDTSFELTAAFLRTHAPGGKQPIGILVNASTDAEGWFKGYYATVSASGDANIWRLDGRSRRFLCPAKGKFKVAVNDFNIVKLTRTKTTIAYQLNGNLVCSFEEDTYRSGSIAILAPAAVNESVSVRQLEIRPLE